MFLKRKDASIIEPIRVEHFGFPILGFSTSAYP